MNSVAQAFPAFLPSILAAGLQIGSFTIPWSWIFVLAIIVVGLLLIRTAVTLVKVAILVAIAVGVYLFVQFVLNNFG